MRPLVALLALIVVGTVFGCKGPQSEGTFETERRSQSSSAAETPEGLAAFEEFRQSLKRVTIDGTERYVVEGDVLLNDEELKLYFFQPDETGTTTAEGPTIRWAPSTLLTYAVLRSTFRTGQEYDIVVNAVGAAADEWEKTCAIEFNHRADLDGSPGESVPGVMFVVRGVDAGGDFIAEAFQPNAPEADRRILVDWSYFTDDYDRVGVFRHELGHVLGFRHEHIRSLSTGVEPKCPPEDKAYTKAITDYDPKSVMHYPCQGVVNKQFLISDDDKRAAAEVYGPPAS